MVDGAYHRGLVVLGGCLAVILRLAVVVVPVLSIPCYDVVLERLLGRYI